MLPYAEKGYRIVIPEPIAAYSPKITYPKLMEAGLDVETMARRPYEFFEFIELLEKTSQTEPISDSTLKGLKLGFAEAQPIETGTCCGMAGAFGLRKGLPGYEFSQVVGTPLFRSLKDAGVDAIVTERSVCRIHLKEEMGLEVFHPQDLL